MPDEIMGTGWIGCVHLDDRVKVENEWNAAVEGGREYRQLYKFITPTGESISVVSEAVILRDDRTQVMIGAVGFISPASSSIGLTGLARLAEAPPIIDGAVDQSI